MAYAGLVALLCFTTALEGFFRADLTWPVLTTVYGVLCLIATVWRRARPLLVLVGVFGSQFVLRWVSDYYQAGWDTPWSLTLILVLPFALTRRAAGREVVLGLAVLALFPAWIAVREHVSTAIGAAVVIFTPAALGSIARWRAHRRAVERAHALARERAELARELHDTVGHRLAVIAVQVQAARSGPLDAETRELVEVIEEQSTRALAEMRTLVGGLRGDPPQWAQPARIEDLQHLGEGCEVPVEIDIQQPLGELDPSVVAALSRMAREALANALRHARELSKVQVKLRTEEGYVTLEVRDDGMGRAASSAAKIKGGGYGLVGMRERAKLLGGRLEAGPHPDGGWRVHTRLPRALTKGTK